MLSPLRADRTWWWSGGGGGCIAGITTYPAEQATQHPPGAGRRSRLVRPAMMAALAAGE